jgi:hypothetical protein
MHFLPGIGEFLFYLDQAELDVDGLVLLPCKPGTTGQA